MKLIILWVLIIFFIVITSTVVHELVHQYKFSEIDEICFFGYEREDSFLNSGFGWVKADSYWHYEEKIPTIVSFTYMFIATITLVFIVFRKELVGGKMEEEKKELSYVNEDGDEIYGLTQSKKNADEIIKQQKKNNMLMIMLILTLFLILLTFAYVVYRFESGNIIANIVTRCVC